MNVARAYLIHESWVGHQDPQVDINRRQQAALEFVFSKLHSVHVVEFQNQSVHGNVLHYLVSRSRSFTFLKL